ncbi:MAG: AAA family ATPase [Acidimicrobiia bacterium]|nr:AAA family ATPase [Acidimicrobiia bacterium]
MKESDKGGGYNVGSTPKPGSPPIPSNPFHPTFGTSPPLLAGRDREVIRIARAFDHGPRHPDYTLLITGPRGSGKTVLLNEAEDAALALGWRVISVSASVSDLPSRIRAAAWEHLYEMDAGKPARRISSVQVLGLGVSWEERPVARSGLRPDLRGVLTAVAERLAPSGIGLLLTVDELQGLQLPEARELTAAVQHITRRELLPMALVGAALPEIEATILSDRGMTFFQRCARIRLRPLEPFDTELALRRPITDAGEAIENEALQVMVKASRGHPFTIQLLGYHGWEEAFGGRRASRIKVEHARSAAYEAGWAELEQIVKPIWAGLSEMDRSFLVAMARDDGPSSVGEIARRLDRSANYAQNYRRRLIAAGMITSAGRGKVRFLHHGTAEWLTTLDYHPGG